VVAAVVVVVLGAAVAVYAATSGRRSGTAAPASSPGRSTAPSGAASAGPSPAGTPADCVASVVAGMPIEARVGQLLMIGTPVGNPTSIADTVRTYKLGGVFLAGRGSPSSAALAQSTRALQDAASAGPGVRLHIALDQEGGQVQTLRGNDFPAIPSAVEQGRWDQATLRARTVDWAQRLARAGITMDLAPVADTVPAGTADQNPPIGAFDRQYGSAPDAVAQDVGTVVTAVQSTGVVTTLKHFPGLGRVRANTDTSTGAVDRTATVDDPYLQPFASGIHAGSGAVMISSALYPQLDPASVAAFSEPIVTGLLRKRLGFTGVVLSDDLGAAVAVQSVPLGERAVRFVRAGGDVVLSVRSADAGPMATALVAAARGSAAFAARVADAAAHVLRSKYRAGLLTCR
jgi:beta-N-acetylhexosaminidase